MTTLGGFDPSRSLLPVGGGTIQAMSGGGDVSVGAGSMTSLLPQVDARIVGLSGGSIGGDPTASSAQASSSPTGTTTTTSPAYIPPAPSNAGPSNAAPSTSAPLSQVASSSNVDPAKTIPQGNVSSHPLPPVSSSSQSSLVDPKEEKKNPDEVKDESSKVNPQKELQTNTTAKPRKNNNQPPLSEDEKRVPIFGTMYTLKKPKNNSTSFDETQKTILKKLGLDTARLELQRSVLKSLYDEACDTTRSLITMRNCEPFRQIVRSLALHYLNKMNGVIEDPGKEEPVKTEEEPQKEEPQKVEPVEEPVAPSAFTNEERLDAMKEGLVSIYGMPNPTDVNCYCNSTVQLLFSLPEIRVAILSYPCAKPLTDADMESAEAKPSMVLCALRDVFQNLMKDATTIDEYKNNEGTNLPPGIPRSNRIQYIMKVYTAYKKSTIETRQDAAEFLSYLLDEIFSKDEHVKDLADVFRFDQSTYYSCGKGNVPPFKKDSEDIKNQTIWYLSEEKMAEPSVPLTTSSMILSYQKTHPTDKARTECGDENKESTDNQERAEITLSDKNRYLMMNLTRTGEITVTPRIEINGKKYVFHGAILHKTESQGHYSYHLVSSSSIHEVDPIQNLEGIPYMNYSDIYVRKNDPDAYPLSKQARLLVYRSEAAIDEWESHVNELSTKLKREVKKAPSLSTGEPHMKELRDKIPPEDHALLQEIQELRQEEYNTSQVEQASQQQLQTIQQLVAKIEQQTAAIKNNPAASNDSSIEGLENEINQFMEAHQRIVEYDPLKALQQRRVEINDKSNKVMELKAKIDLTLLQPEFTSDVSLMEQWPSLTSKVSSRIEDRRNVLKTYEEAFTTSQQKIQSMEKEEKKIKTAIVQYIQQVQLDLQKLGQVTNPSADEKSYEEQLRNKFSLRSAQEYYDEMVQSDEYRQNAEKLQQLEQKIKQFTDSLHLLPPPIELDIEQDEKHQQGSNQEVHAPPVFIDDIEPLIVQQGGSLDEMEQLVARYNAYQQDFKEFDETLVLKDTIVQNYREKHLHSPYERLLQKDGQQVEEEKTLPSMDRLRHMIIRHRLLKEYLTVIQEFDTLVEDPKEIHLKEYTQVSNGVSEEIQKRMNSNDSNDFTNALYHFLVKGSHDDPTFSDLFTTFSATTDHDTLINTWSQSPIDIADLEKEFESFSKQIDEYNQKASDPALYAELPPLYQQLIHQLEELEKNIVTKAKNIEQFWIEPHDLYRISIMVTLYNENYPELVKYYEHLQNIPPIPVLTSSVKDSFKERLETIRTTLDEWAKHVETYYTRVQQHNVVMDEVKEQLSDFGERFDKKIMMIQLEKSAEPFNSQSYRDEYKKTMIGDDNWLALEGERKEDLPLQDSIQKIISEDASYQAIKSGLDQEYVSLLAMNEFQPYETASDAYHTKSDKLLKSLSQFNEDIQSTIQGIFSQKEAVEKERAEFEEKVEQFTSKMNANTQTNQSSTSLGTATPLSLQQTLQKVEARKELRDQIQLKRDEFVERKKALDQQARDLDTKVLLMEQVKTDLNDRESTLFMKFTELFTIEGAMVKESMDAIRTSKKITAKMNGLRSDIQQLEKNMEMAPNNNAATIQALIKQKQQKLESLTQSHAEQQAKIKREISNQALEKEQSELKLDDSLTTLLESETSENVASLTQMLDLVNRHMTTMYPPKDNWTPDKIKAILTHVKKQLSDLHNIAPNLSIKNVIFADDFLLLFFHAAVEKGYLTEDENPYAKEIQDNQEAIQASTDPLGVFIRQLEKIPKTDQDTLKSIIDVLNGVHDRMKKDQIDQFTEKEEIETLIRTTVNRIREEHMEHLYTIVRDMVKQKEKKPVVPSEEEEEKMIDNFRLKMVEQKEKNFVVPSDEEEEEQKMDESLTADTYKDARAIIEMLMDVSYMKPIIEFYQTRHSTVVEQKKLAQQVEAARLSAKLDPKIQKLKEFIGAYDSEKHLYTLNQNQEVTEAYVNKKRAKLAELETLYAKQQEIIMGNAKKVEPLLENKSTYPEVELNDATQSLIGNNNVNEAMDRKLDLGKRVHDYMERAYPAIQWSPDNSKKVILSAYEMLHKMDMDAVTIDDLLEADDFLFVLFLAASVAKPDIEKPSSYVYRQDFYQRIQEDPSTMYDQLVKELTDRGAYSDKYLPTQEGDLIHTLIDQMKEIHTLILGSYETIHTNVSDGEEDRKENQVPLSNEDRFMKQVRDAFEGAKKDHLKKHVEMFKTFKESCSSAMTPDQCDEYRKRMELAMGYLYPTPEGTLLFEDYYRTWFRAQEEEARIRKEEEDARRAEEERLDAERKAKEKANANYASMRGDLQRVLTDLREVILAVSAKEVMTEVEERVHENLVEVYDAIKRELEQNPPSNSSRAERKRMIKNRIVTSLQNIIGQADRVALLPPGAVDKLQHMVDQSETIADWILGTKKSNRNKNVQNYEEFMKPIRNQSSQRAQKIANAKAAEERRRLEEEEQARIRREKEEANRLEKARLAKEREEEEKRREEIRRAQFEKERGEREAKITLLKKEIDIKKGELAPILKTLKDYEQVKARGPFVTHYDRIKGRFSKQNRKKVNDVLSTNPNKLVQPQLDALIPLLQSYLSPDARKLEKEISELEGKIDQLEHPEKYQIPNKTEVVSQNQLNILKTSLIKKKKEYPNIEGVIQSAKRIQSILRDSKQNKTIPPVTDEALLDMIKLLVKHEHISQIIGDYLSKQPRNKQIEEIDLYLPKFIEEMEYTHARGVNEIQEITKNINKMEKTIKKNVTIQVTNDITALVALKKVFSYQNKEHVDGLMELLSKYPMGQSYIDEFNSYTNLEKETESDKLIDRFINDLSELRERNQSGKKKQPAIPSKSNSYFNRLQSSKNKPEYDKKTENDKINKISSSMPSLEEMKQSTEKGKQIRHAIVPPQGPISRSALQNPNTTRKLQNKSIKQEVSSSSLAESLKRANNLTKKLQSSKQELSYNEAKKASANELAQTQALLRKLNSNRKQQSATASASLNSGTRSNLYRNASIAAQSVAPHLVDSKRHPTGPSTSSFNPGMVKKKPTLSTPPPRNVAALQQSLAIAKGSTTAKLQQQVREQSRKGGSIKRKSTQRRRVTRKQKK
jgi:hypothetical protein